MGHEKGASGVCRSVDGPERGKQGATLGVITMKPEQVIRDRCSNRVGGIVDNGQQLVARHRFGRNLGYYDKQGNVTRDRNSNRICQGDTLSSLILRAAGS